MADLDYTRKFKTHEKKSECFMCTEVTEGEDFLAIDTGDDNYHLGNIPNDAIITDAYIMLKTASDAATSATATLGTAPGGTEIMSAGDLTAAAGSKTGTFTGESLTDTGKPLWLKLVYAGAVTDVGDYVVVVEYVEFTLNTGNLTRMTQGLA